MKLEKIILLVLLFVATTNTYSQIDSLEKRILYNWKLNPYDLSVELVEIDTTLTAFQNFNPLLKNTISSNYLGNLGSAAQPKVYYDRDKYKTGFIFSEPFGIYFHQPKGHLYFNTKRQFTLFNYSTGGPNEESEQVLGFLHTQNVNKDFNFGFDYDLISSAGRYQNQEIKQNLISLFSSYKNKGYKLHTNFGFNRVKGQENGGIDSLQFLNDNDYSNRKNIPVRLNDARTQVFNTNLYIAHEYNFGRTHEEVREKEDEAIMQQKSIVNRLSKGLPNLGVVNSELIKDTLNIEHTNAEITDSTHSDSADFDQTNIEVVDSVLEDSISFIQTNAEIADSVISDSTSFIYANAEVADSVLGDSIILTQTSIEDSLNVENTHLDTIRIFKASGFSVSHELTYNSDIRKFYDDNLDEDFYMNKDIFVDSSQTYDKISQRQFGNKFALNYKYSDKFSARVAFYNEIMNYNYNIRPDTIAYLPVVDTIIRKDTSAKYYNNNVSAYLKALLFNRIYFSGYAEYFISGYKNEDSKLDFKFAYIHKRDFEISLEGQYKNQRPDFFFENYTSNNIKWNNGALGKVEEWDAGFAVRSPKYKFSAKLQYGQLTNYLYLDSAAYVKKHTGTINILSADAYKHFKVGPVNSITRFVYQKSSNDSLLNIPEINLYQSLYIEYLWKFPSTGGELLWQLGVDYKYTSEYTPDSYMPPLGMFHRQYDYTQENYQCLDLFINLNIKRVRIYLKYSYLNTAINEEYYLTGHHYPAPDPIFKWGLAWTFYD